jgi:hypothetical protein
MGTSFFMPRAPAASPTGWDAEYDLLEKRVMFNFERFLAGIFEREDADTFEKLIEVIQDLMGHCAWCFAAGLNSCGVGRRCRAKTDRWPPPERWAERRQERGRRVGSPLPAP